MTESKPEILRPQAERALRIILRAIITAHPGQIESGQEARLETALAALLGLKPRRGRSDVLRNDLLEMMAFDYSIKGKGDRSTDVSVTQIAKRLVQYHPTTKTIAGKDAVIRYLVRKFCEHKAELLLAHSFDGKEDFEAFYKPIAEALAGLRQVGINVDCDVLPWGAQGWSREK